MKGDREGLVETICCTIMLHLHNKVSRPFHNMLGASYTTLCDCLSGDELGTSACIPVYPSACNAHNRYMLSCVTMLPRLRLAVLGVVQASEFASEYENVNEDDQIQNCKQPSHRPSHRPSHGLPQRLASH